MEAIRADEAAAGVMGVNLPGQARRAGRFAAIAGLRQAPSTRMSRPSSDQTTTASTRAVTILSFALLGGIGSPFGPVLGALVLTALPEVLRPLHDYRLVIDGLLSSSASSSSCRTASCPGASVGSEPAHERPASRRRDLTVRFGGLTALSGVTFQVTQARCTV